ncbi:tRNA (adenosine(37)-N6)-threonylcarbamoyltransferase complex transferase subunit TsaD [Candidatus Gracilibacteria bacterium]|nr:tRNA (adenosine(37)-N6)-threonylcarbamoyltransferase complex transferase subunit TsaD [Candidatus Gracilibacteria bacterium]
MKIIAFETSCDDTSIALFEDEKLICMETASQIKIHNITGGVVPEVAAREHANAIFGVLDTVLEKSGVKLEEIDYIGVTTNPGLLPSLLTGTTVSSTISTILKIPIIPINHIQAHIFANFLEREEKEIQFPVVCLTVSGGHNDIYSMKDIWDLEKVGSTTDDASGEAFDKVAKMMGLGYPGGPIVSQLADEYAVENNKNIDEIISDNSERKTLFPRVWLTKKEADFSFSGLKSAVKREVDKRRGCIVGNGIKPVPTKDLTLEDQKEISYEFQEAVIEVLAYKLIQVAQQKGVKTVLLAGGVSANNRLKAEITKLAQKNNLNFLHPVNNLYCMDNAAMVGILTYYRVKYGEFERKIGVVKV